MEGSAGGMLSGCCRNGGISVRASYDAGCFRADPFQGSPVSKECMNARAPFAVLPGIVLLLAGIALPIVWTLWMDIRGPHTGCGEDPQCFLSLVLVTLGAVSAARSLMAHRERQYRKAASVAQPGPQTGDLHLDTQAGLPPEPPVKGLQLTTSARLGIACIVLGAPVFVSAQYRLATHTFTGDVTALTRDDVSLLLYLSVMCVAVGVSLVLFFSITRFNRKSLSLPRLGQEEKAGQYFQWAQRLPLRKRFAAPPSFGLLATICFFLVLIPMWVLQAGRLSFGLNVHLLKPGVTPASYDFGSGPVILQLKCDRKAGCVGAPPRLYFSSKPVAWGELGATVQAALKSRPDRIVYLEGDPKMMFNDAIKAIDIIRTGHAEVVLLTPDKKAKAAGRSNHRKGR